MKYDYNAQAQFNIVTWVKYYKQKEISTPLMAANEENYN